MTQKTTSLQAFKNKNTPISMLTCYDYPTAIACNQGNIDSVLVGDSLGTNVLGYPSEKDVTLTDMIHHTKAVARGINHAFIIADLPFNTYSSKAKALESAKKLIQAGADAVKFEGYLPTIMNTLTHANITCIGHLGLLPQTATKKSLQARTEKEATILIQHAIELQKNGAHALIVELIPESLAKTLSETLTIPVIGIGAGRHCDGQVQIIYDITGQSPVQYKHATPYTNLNKTLTNIITHYHNDIKANTLLTDKHCF